MKIRASVLVLGAIEDVFDFLDDPANTMMLGGHAAEHARGFTQVTGEDGRRTFDIKMQAGGRAWTQTIQQVIRERPSRHVWEAWTWDDDRTEPHLRVTVDRMLTAEQDGTRLSTAIEYTPAKRPLLGKLLGWLQRGQTQTELDHQLHFLAERFAARDIQRR